MTNRAPFRTLDFVCLLAIVALAAGTRLWFLHACADDARTLGPLQVQEANPVDLDRLVVALCEERGYGITANGTLQPTARPAPLYPWLLAQLLTTTDFQSSLQTSPDERDDLSDLHERVRWVQAGLGSLTAGLLFVFARSALGGRGVGILTGLLAAAHPFWIINVAEIDDGVLVTFLLAACLVCGTLSLGEGMLTAWLFGLSLAALSLTRAALLPFAFIALLWLLRRCRTLPHGAAPALLAVVGFASGLTPWAMRNYRVFHDVFPIADSTYYHLWLGNRPGATGGPLPEPTAEELQLDDAARARIILDEIERHPADTLRRRLWAGLYFLFGSRWFQDGQLWRGGEPEDWAGCPDWLAQGHAAILHGSLLGMLALAPLGWRWSYPHRLSAQPATLALIWVPLPYIISHAGVLQGPRLPLDAVLLCYAAVALATIGTSLRRWR